MQKKTKTRQPFTVPPSCYGNCKDCPKHIRKIKNTECECCQSCKDWETGVGGAPGGHRFKKSRRKASKQKSSKRKVSKRKVSKRKL